MYFDPTLPVTLQVDASDYGLGGALLQPNKDDEYQPVAFTSSTLSRAERNYSQIEKECLAIVHTMDHFDHWLFGKDRVTVHMDHQPLETIFKKPLSKAPSRLQRMMMKLQRYMFVVSYRPGKSLWIADTLSRAPLPRPVSLGLDQCSVFRTDLELEGQNPLFKEITTIMLREATATDPLLQMLMQVIIKGFPVLRSELPSDLQPFWNFRDELTVIDGTIYKAHQCFIPASFRSEMLRRIHAAHSGAASNLRLAKEFIFWPGMAKSIEDMCNSCGICAQFPTSAPRLPMRSLPVPRGPVELISQDLCAHKGQAYLITVCHYSDWLEIDRLPDTLSATVVNATKEHIARFGIPTWVLTDNGPQFIAKEYKDLARDYGFTCLTSSPYYQRGNGKAESAVKIAKSMLKKCSDYHKALLLYRNTPQQGYSYSPAQRMLKRKTRNTLSVCPTHIGTSQVDPKVARHEIQQCRAQSKSSYDQHASSPRSDIHVGSEVYAKPKPTDRGQPWKFGTVIDSPGPDSYVLRTPDGKDIRRNQRDIAVSTALPLPLPERDAPVSRVPVPVLTAIPVPPVLVPPTPQAPRQSDFIPNPAISATPIRRPQLPSPVSHRGGLQIPSRPCREQPPLVSTRVTAPGGRQINLPARFKDYEMG